MSMYWSNSLEPSLIELVFGVHDRGGGEDLDVGRDLPRGGGDHLLQGAVLEHVAGPAADAAALPRLVVVLQAPQGAVAVLPIAPAEVRDPLAVTLVHFGFADPVAGAPITEGARPPTGGGGRLAEGPKPARMSAERDHDLAAGLLGGSEELVVASPSPVCRRPTRASLARTANRARPCGRTARRGFPSFPPGSASGPRRRWEHCRCGHTRAAWVRGRAKPGTAASPPAPAPRRRCRSGPAAEGP